MGSRDSEKEKGFFICHREPRTVLAASQKIPSVDIFRFPWEYFFKNLSGLVNASEVGVGVGGHLGGCIDRWRGD